MAKLNVSDTVSYGRQEVFETFRDHLTDLVEYLPNIREIEVEDREQLDDSTIKVVNLWKATQKDVPSLARKFIKPKMLQWTDHATWREDQWVCDWEMEVGFLEDAITCVGQNRYLEVGDDETRIEIDGDLRVDAGEIPGVPRLVASKVGKTVENFVVKLIEPNLTDVNRGLERYLNGQNR